MENFKYQRSSCSTIRKFDCSSNLDIRGFAVIYITIMRLNHESLTKT